MPIASILTQVILFFLQISEAITNFNSENARDENVREKVETME